MTGGDPERVSVDDGIRLPGEMQEHLHRSEDLWAPSTEAQSAAAAEVRGAARQRCEQRMVLRDMGTVSGVAHQRTHEHLR